MKKSKLLLTVIVSLAFWSTALGQAGKLTLSLEAGGTLGGLRGNPVVEKHNTAPGFIGGLGFAYGLTDVLSVKLSPSFERKSTVFKIESNYVGPDRNVEYTGEAVSHHHFSYLTLPVMARLNFGEGKRFFVNAGPYAAYLINFTSVSKAFYTFPKSSMDGTNSMKKLDIGGTLGAGMVFPVHEKFSLTAELRGNLGLLDINKTKSPIGTNKLSSLNIIVGVVKL